jgi:hypothetical protein
MGRSILLALSTFLGFVLIFPLQCSAMFESNRAINGKSHPGHRLPCKLPFPFARTSWHRCLTDEMGQCRASTSCSSQRSAGGVGFVGDLRIQVNRAVPPAEHNKDICKSHALRGNGTSPLYPTFRLMKFTTRQGDFLTHAVVQGVMALGSLWILS